MTVDKIMKEKGVTADHLRKLCGLPISTYFSALKVSELVVSKSLALGCVIPHPSNLGHSNITNQ